MSSSRFLFRNGTVMHSTDAAAPITTFLESHSGTPTQLLLLKRFCLLTEKLLSFSGAYTTTRTYNTASCLLFWERHVKRLSDSIRILSSSAPKLLFQSNNPRLSLPVTSPMWESAVRALVDDSMNKALPMAMNERSVGEELSVTVLVCGRTDRFNGFEYVDEELMREALDVYVSVGCYVPRAFGVRGNGARLAVVGHGRDVANAKYSDWVRSVCLFPISLFGCLPKKI